MGKHISVESLIMKPYTSVFRCSKCHFAISFGSKNYGNPIYCFCGAQYRITKKGKVKRVNKDA